MVATILAQCVYASTTNIDANAERYMRIIIFNVSSFTTTMIYMRRVIPLAVLAPHNRHGIYRWCVVYIIRIDNINILILAIAHCFKLLVPCKRIGVYQSHRLSFLPLNLSAAGQVAKCDSYP